MKINVKYIAKFETTIEVRDDATYKEIADEVSNITIPEDDVSVCVDGSFEPITNNFGYIKLFNEDGEETTLKRLKDDAKEILRRDKKNGLYGPD